MVTYVELDPKKKMIRQQIFHDSHQIGEINPQIHPPNLKCETSKKSMKHLSSNYPTNIYLKDNDLPTSENH